MPDPVLHTERVTLRPLTAALAGSLLNQPLRHGQHADGFPSPDDEQLLRGVVASGPDARGSFLLERGSTPIGTAGAAGGLTPDGDQELGYGLVPAARGQGLATEAVGALCSYLERGEGVRRLIAEVLPGNESSLRLLRRLGFVAVTGGSADHQLMARGAPGHPQPVPALPARIVGRHVC